MCMLTVSVELPGPPPVITKGSANSSNASIDRRMTATINVSRIIGSVLSTTACQAEAPSTSALSSRYTGITCRTERDSRTMHIVQDQTHVMTIETITRFGA